MKKFKKKTTKYVDVYASLIQTTKVSMAKVYNYLADKNFWKTNEETILECSCTMAELNLFLKKTHPKIGNNSPYLDRMSTYECHCRCEGLSYKTKPYFYYVSKSALYGHTKYLYCLGAVYIYFTVHAAKWKEGMNFKFGLYQYDENDVYLDVETTGLNPVIDDIISIAAFQPSTGKTFQKYLPLEKQTAISSDITDINGITALTLINSLPLTQEDVDNIIANFNLRSNKITIWTGNNMFDMVFLHCYFANHNLIDRGTFEFQNAREAAVQYPDFSDIHGFSKDTIAAAFSIDLSLSHRALEDCKIEAQICEAIHNNIRPKMPAWDAVIYKMTDDFASMTTDESLKLYSQLCNWCIVSNGPVMQDYDQHPRTRGAEGIDIHHMDEITLDDICRRTQDALCNNDGKTLTGLRPFNHCSRLVYATKGQHFLLHCLIEKIRRGRGGGPHYLYACLLVRGECFNYRDIYAQLIQDENLNLDDIIETYWATVFEQDDYKLADAQGEIKELRKLIATKRL